MMEKHGVIEPGRTPPEHETDKTASELESHPTQRAADAAKEELGKFEKRPLSDYKRS